MLLADIRAIFDALGLDRINSAALVEALLGLDDSLWNDWRGLRDDRPARKLNQGELARLLRPFDIRPRSVWSRGQRPTAGSRKGYYGEQFEQAWAAYCPADGTAAHPRKIIRLLRR